MDLPAQDFENRTAERVLRVADFLANTMQPDLEVIDDTAAYKVRRVGDGALRLAKKLPLSTRVVAAVNSLDAVRKFGHLGAADEVERAGPPQQRGSAARAAAASRRAPRLAPKGMAAPPCTMAGVAGLMLHEDLLSMLHLLKKMAEQGRSRRRPAAPP